VSAVEMNYVHRLIELLYNAMERNGRGSGFAIFQVRAAAQPDQQLSGRSASRHFKPATYATSTPRISGSDFFIAFASAVGN